MDAPEETVVAGPPHAFLLRHLVGLIALSDIRAALVEHRRPNLRPESNYDLIEKLRAG